MSSTIEHSLKQLRDIKEEKELLSAQLKELNSQEEYLEQMIISQLRQEGLQKASVEDIGTASIKVTLYPAIKDWDTTIKWMAGHKDFTLLKKSINAAGWRERVESGEELPGVEGFEKDTLLFRKK